MPIEETLCPDCGGKMVSRVNSHTQQRFWGCANFPVCKGTRDTDGQSKKDREPRYAQLMSLDTIPRWDR